MESYQVKFGLASSNDSKKNLPASGDLFVYESGVAASGADTRIRVKPDAGATIILRPGQSFRNPNKSTAWAIETYSGVDVIDATFVIGFGEFNDANTLNKVTLDATFANVVKVSNTIAERVPVSLDVNQTLQLAQSVMAYTNSYSSTATSVANTAINMLTAAANVNGVILNKFEIITQAATAGAFAVLAKATAPASMADGDVLFSSNLIGASAIAKVAMDISKDGQPKVAAGKGIWYICTQADSPLLRDALMTVL